VTIDKLVFYARNRARTMGQRFISAIIRRFSL
jgi:hypothetical protein